MKTSRRRGAVVIQRDILHFSTSGFGHLVEQKTIHGSADAECKHTRVRMLLDLGDDLHLVADVTVSHEANDTNVRLIVRWLKRRFDRFHHLGATRAVTRTEKRLGLSQV